MYIYRTFPKQLGVIDLASGCSIAALCNFFWFNPIGSIHMLCVGLNLKLLHLVAFEVEVLILQHGVALLGIDLILFRSVLLGFFPCSSANMEREAKVDKVSMWFFGLDAMLEEPTTFDGEACEPAPLQGAFAGCKRLQVLLVGSFGVKCF